MLKPILLQSPRLDNLERKGVEEKIVPLWFHTGICYDLDSDLETCSKDNEALTHKYSICEALDK